MRFNKSFRFIFSTFVFFIAIVVGFQNCGQFQSLGEMPVRPLPALENATDSLSGPLVAGSASATYPPNQKPAPEYAVYAHFWGNTFYLNTVVRACESTPENYPQFYITFTEVNNRYPPRSGTVTTTKPALSSNSPKLTFLGGYDVACGNHSSQFYYYTTTPGVASNFAAYVKPGKYKIEVRYSNTKGESFDLPSQTFELTELEQRVDTRLDPATCVDISVGEGDCTAVLNSNNCKVSTKVLTKEVCLDFCSQQGKWSAQERANKNVCLYKGVAAFRGEYLKCTGYLDTDGNGGYYTHRILESGKSVTKETCLQKCPLPIALSNGTSRMAEVCTFGEGEAFGEIIWRNNTGDMCGSHPSGSIWWENVPPEAIAQSCPSGGSLTHYYAQEKEVKCVNRVVVPTGQKRQGALLQAVGACNNGETSSVAECTTSSGSGNCWASLNHKGCNVGTQQPSQTACWNYCGTKGNWTDSERKEFNLCWYKDKFISGPGQDVAGGKNCMACANDACTEKIASRAPSSSDCILLCKTNVSQMSVYLSKGWNACWYDGVPVFQ